MPDWMRLAVQLLALVSATAVLFLTIAVLVGSVKLLFDIAF